MTGFTKLHVLKNHSLAQFPELQVSEDLLQARFASYCNASKCKGECCWDGAGVDIAERDRILAHAEIIQNTMDAHQEKDPTKWFHDAVNDSDFPSGAAAVTTTHQNACVFLNSENLCVLHKATREKRVAIDIKPFFCTAFPITINKGILMLDEGHVENMSHCCTVQAEGSKSVFDVCAYELNYMLGKEGVEELKQMALITTT